MATREIVVALDVAEALAHLCERPELASDGPLRLDARPDGGVIKHRRARPPFEDYELAPQQLRVWLAARGDETVVTAALRIRPAWRGIAGSLALGLSHFGANWLADASDWRDIQRRRASDRRELLAVLAATYGPHEVEARRDPFRGR